LRGSIDLRRAPPVFDWNMNDIKELIGTLMRVIDGAEISEDDVTNLDFEADGELMIALNAAYIQLLEFVHDHDLRLADGDVDSRERRTLQESLNKIVELSGNAR
jgi:hypothetical protein